MFLKKFLFRFSVAIGVLFGITLLIPTQVHGFACKSNVASGNWASSTTWTTCNSTFPQTTDTVTILNGHTITLNANTTVSSITINSGGTLSCDSNNRTITLTATAAIPFTKAATGVFNPNNSTVIINGNAAITVSSGNITFNHLIFSPTISAARTYTMGVASITVNGNWTINPATTSVLALSVNLSSTVVVLGTTTITRTNSATSTLSTTASNRLFSTGLMNIATGGTFTANGSTVTFTGSSGTLFTRTGTFTNGASVIVFKSNAGVTLTNNTTFTFTHLEMTPTLTADRIYTLGNGALTVNGRFTINPVKTDAGNATLTVNMGAGITLTATQTTTITGTTNAYSNLTTGGFALSQGFLSIGTNGTLTANAATITLTGTSGTLMSVLGSFVPGTSTVVMNPNAAVTTMSGNITFNNLTFSPTITAPRIYSMSTSSLTINGNWSINPTAATAQALTVNLASTTLVLGTTTVTRTTSATSTLDTTTSNYLFTTGNLNIATSGTFNANGSTITLTGTTGTLLTRAGTFNQGASHVVINPDSSSTLTSGTITFNKLSITPTITTARTYTLGAGALIINDDFTLNPTAVSVATLTVNMGASITMLSTKTITLTGTSNGYGTLNTGTNQSLTVGKIDLQTQGGLSANASTITVTGTTGPTFIRSGLFTAGTSLVTINADADITPIQGNVTFRNLTLSPTITTNRTYTLGSSSITLNGALSVTPNAAGAFSLEVDLSSALRVIGGVTLSNAGSASARLDTTISNHPITMGSINITSGETFVGNGSTITFTGTSGTIFTEAGSFLEGTSLVSFESDAAVTLTSNNSITFANLSLDPTITASRVYTMGTSSLTVTGGFTVQPNASGAFTLTVNLGSTTVVGGLTNLTRSGIAISSFSTTSSSHRFFSSSLTIDTGANFIANGSTMTLTGTNSPLLISNGTFTPGTSTLVISPDVDITPIQGNVTIYNLNLTPTITASRVYTLGSSSITLNGALSITPNSAGAFSLEVDLSSALRVVGAVTLSNAGSASARLDTTVSNHPLTMGSINITAGETLAANGSTITFTGTSGTLFTEAGTFLEGTSLVSFESDAAVTLTSNNSITFANLSLDPTITANRAYTLGTSSLTVTGDFTMIPNSAGAFSLTLSLSSSAAVGGHLNLSRSGTATSTFTTTTSNHRLYAGRITADTGSTFVANGSTITLTSTSGTLLTRNGTFSNGTSLIEFTPDADVTLTGSNAITFTNVDIEPTLTTDRTYSFGSGALTVNGRFNLNPVKSTAGNATLNVVLGASVTVAASQTTNITGTTNAFSNLNTGSNWAITQGFINIGTNGTFTANASSITLTGTSGTLFTKAGTFIPGTSSVVMNPDAAITTTSGNIIFNNLFFSPTLTVGRIYTMGSSSITVNGNWTINPSATALALTVNFSSSVVVLGTTTITRSSTATSSLSTSASNHSFRSGCLSVQTGGTFTANGSTITLTASSGVLLVRFGTFTQGTSRVNVAPLGNTILSSGTVTFVHLDINGLGFTTSMVSPMTISGNLSVSNGTLADGGNQITGNATGLLSIAAGANLSLGSNTVATTFPTSYTTGNTSLNVTSTVTYNSGVAQTVSATPTYGNLNLLAPTGTPLKSAAAAITVANDFMNGTNSTFTVTASNFALAIGGNYTNNGTFVAQNGTVTFNSSSAGETISGNLSGTSQFRNIVFSNGGGWSNTSAMVIGGTMTVTAGTISGTNDITVNGNVLGNGTNGTINLTGGTFEQRVAANQTFGTNVAGANNWTFNNLTFSNSSAVNRTITTNSLGSGQIIINGTLTIGNVADTSSTTLTNQTSGRVIDANSHVTITTKGVFSANTTTPMTIAGNWTNNGSFTHNNSTVTFDGTGTKTLTGSTTFYALNAVTSGCTLEFTAGTTYYVTNKLTLQNVTLQSTLNGATWYFTFSGSSQTVSSVDVQDSNASGGLFILTQLSTNSGNCTNWDFLPPGAIVNLLATPGSLGATVLLTWSSPGSEGSIGTLLNSTFTIQYTTDTAFASGASWSPTAAQPGYVFRINIATTNLTPGTNVSTTTSGLISGGTYYFRAWTLDNAGNYSQISNGATNYTTTIVLGVSMSTNSIQFGSLTAGTTNVITTSVTFTNTGNVVQKYLISINNPAIWIATTSVAGSELFRLTGIFKNTLPVSADFSAANDVITTSTSTASTTIHARDADSDTEKGFNVIPGGVRTMWFRMEVPTMTSTTTEQIIQLNGTASQ